MNWGGKIIGGTLGMLALGPLGAALGAFIGHQFDSGSAAVLRPGGSRPARVNELFFPITFRVMGHIAKADGRVSEQEIASARAVMSALHLNAAQVQAAIAYFQEGKQPGFDLERALRPLCAAITAYPDLARFFIEIQLQAAISGNGLSDLPRARLQRAALQVGVGTVEFARLESMLRWSHSQNAPRAATAPTGERLRQAYCLLEAEATMSDEEIVKAYRRQMSRHHPDKLQANGLPDSMLERAKERTQQIAAAYELIREARGLR